jgi:bifunctional non-homologous end joining protein LigD
MTDEIPFRVQPMLATLVSEPFNKPGWVYEEKYDGFRILAYKEGSGVSLLSRNGKERNQTYPNIAAAVAKLPYRTLLLDGEVAAFDNRRISRFQLLQEGCQELTADKKLRQPVFLGLRDDKSAKECFFPGETR